MSKGVFLICAAFTNAPSRSEVRKLYKEAATEETSCRKLIILLSSYNEHNNTVLAGYKACATMMMANHLLNPVNKLSNFKEGKQQLELIIQKDNQNPELRFLRFSIQTNIPSFLNYNESIEADKSFILQSLSRVNDEDLKHFMVSFLKDSDYMTTREKQTLLQ
jgi:hypothetical protein